MTKKNKDAGKVTVIEKDNSCCELCGLGVLVVLVLIIASVLYFNYRSDEDEKLLRQFNTDCNGTSDYNKDFQEVRCEFNGVIFHFPFTKNGVLQAANVDSLAVIIRHIDNHGER